MDFFEICNWLMLFVTLLGAYLNSQKNIKGFYLWVISNTYFFAYNLVITEYSQAILFIVYLVITLNGLRVWAAKK